MEQTSGKLRGIKGLSSVSLLTFAENWRDFFDRPSAQERRRQDEAKKEEAESRIKPINLPPIQYIGEDAELRPGDPGIRLLKMVTVQVYCGN